MPFTLGLEALDFAMAGAREGFGPFLGVFLQAEGFNPASTGFAMSLAGAAGVLATAPLGSLVDRITAKRTAVVLAVLGIAVGAGLIVLTKSLRVVAIGQVVIGVADTSLAPLVSAMTLGVVGRERYPAQVARNETFNHGGNAINAALSAALGYWLGLGWVALAIAVMALVTCGVVSRIDPGTIDDEAARGGDPGSKSAWRALFDSRPLLMLGLAAFAFEMSSGAILPFLAQSLVKAGHDASLSTGAMAVTVQVVMIGSAAAVPWLPAGSGMRMCWPGARPRGHSGRAGGVERRSSCYWHRRSAGRFVDGPSRRRDPGPRHRHHGGFGTQQRGPGRGHNRLRRRCGS